MKWLLALAVVSLPAWGAERSAPLSLAQAKTLLQAAGVSVGKVFAEDPSASTSNRYALTRLEGRQLRPNVFMIEIEVTPLPRFGQ